MISAQLGLESKFGAQFHGAIAVPDAAAAGTLVSCTGDASKGRGGQAHTGIAEVRSVGYAEGLGSKFESHSFPYGEVAEYSCIEIEESRAGELITPHVAEHTVANNGAVWIRVCASRLAKRRSIEPQVGV